MYLTIKRFFVVIIGLFLLNACQKKEIDVSFKEFSGDYEWYYSASGVAFDVSEDQYGIRMTSKGRLKFFKNGELTESYKIYKTSDETTLGPGVWVWANNEENPIICGFNSDTLTTYASPYKHVKNYYIKIK